MSHTLPSHLRSRGKTNVAITGILAGMFALAMQLAVNTAAASTLRMHTQSTTNKTSNTQRGLFPSTPPAKICGNAAQLQGPSTPPAGAIVIPPGDNSTVNWNQPGATFYFQSGTHTLGTSVFSQILPPQGSSFVGAPNAVLSGQGVNYFAFTQTAPNVTIEYLTIENFVAPLNQGVVNTNTATGWVIEHDTITNNAGAGVFVGPSNVVEYNCISSNGQYGFQMINITVSDTNATLSYNEIAGNNTANTEVVYPGCGCSGAGKVWNTIGATITNNWVHDNLGPGIWADTDNAGILISGNYINNNQDEAIIYEISYNGQITNNNILDNAIVKGQQLAATGSTFPVAAIYLLNSGGNPNVAGGLYSTFVISGNNLFDNWGGVAVFQDANRFCGSTPGINFCTMGDPAATLTTCVAGSIQLQPLLSDCQWKSQNIEVFNNTFSFNPSDLGCTSAACGVQAIFGDQGMAPSWSPYLGWGVETAITTQQNNLFYDNTYTGPWHFDWGTIAGTFTQWQGGPANQDAGSTLNGVTYPPSPAGNYFDADTATLEGSLGYWQARYSATIAQSNAYAQAGKESLQVHITNPSGWGLQLSNNAFGYNAQAGATTVSFWGMAAPNNPDGGLAVAMQLQWGSASGVALGTTTVEIPTLTTSWQQVSVPVTAPAGTATMTAIVGAPNSGADAGGPGDVVYLDNFFVGPTPVNALDANTSTFNKTLGKWVVGINTTLTRVTTTTVANGHDLKIKLVAAGAWSVSCGTFKTTGGMQQISFSGLAGSGSLQPMLQVQWENALGAVLGMTDDLLPNPNTTIWQQATANTTAPAGTSQFAMTVSGSSGNAGNTISVDNFFVGP